MTQSNIAEPTQFEFLELTIAGIDALKIFVNIEIFENIFIGGVVGSISIIDSDGLDFIGSNNIEFIEEISFTFKNALGKELRFEGYMNGLRDEIIKNQKKVYVIDFTSKTVRKNENVFINNTAPFGVTLEDGSDSLAMSLLAISLAYRESDPMFDRFIDDYRMGMPSGFDYTYLGYPHRRRPFM